MEYEGENRQYGDLAVAASGSGYGCCDNGVDPATLIAFLSSKPNFFSMQHHQNCNKSNLG